MLQEINIENVSLDSYRSVVGDEYIENLLKRGHHLKEQLAKARIFNINSTAKGGGVAEMLYTLPGYGKYIGMDLRWLVIEGDEQFFSITKRIHNFIHDNAGDGNSLSQTDHNHYQKISISNARDLLSIIRAGDVLILHDPQTAGLIPILKQEKVKVIWRCHIGHDGMGNYAKQAWSFLRSYLVHADAYVFSRKEYIPDFILATKKYNVITPSVDLLSAKNQYLCEQSTKAILGHIGIIHYSDYTEADLLFKQKNGELSQVNRYADIICCGPRPKVNDLMVAQISRWDRLKDMLGVMQSFADYVLDHENFHLVLAGPSVHGVTDDPEGVIVFNNCLEAWRSLSHFKRSRIQLVCLPMKDIEENGVMVNAIQRHATVIVQKSIYEGFGLTVTEALIKGKAVLASKVGGIQDQITHGETGLLVDNPTDLESFGVLLKMLLHDKKLRDKLGRGGFTFSHQNFLIPQHLNRYVDLFESLL